MDLGLTNKVAVVTGASKGIGLAVTRALIEEGAYVVAGARTGEALEGIERVTAVALDLAAPEGPAALIERAVDEHGRVDVLVNNVGGVRLRLEGFLGTSDDEFEWSMQLNFFAALRAIRAALGPMVEQGGGAIVCVGAKAALLPFKGSPGYNVAKAAVVAFVRSLAIDYRDDGIRANAVLPSVIDTAANRQQMPKADHAKWVPPVQIARVIRFLCSPDSAPTSGAAIPVYGRAG